MVTGFEYDKLQTQKALVIAINILAKAFELLVENTKFPSIQLDDKQMAQLEKRLAQLEKIVKGIQKRHETYR